MDNLFHVIYTSIVAYSITKARLMDISVIISRSVAWGLTVASLAIIYLATAILYRSFVSTRIDWLFLTWNVLFGLFVGLYFHNIRLFLQTTSDKLFLKGRYNYYQALSDVSSQITRNLSLKDILKTLYDTFYNQIEVSTPRVYLPENFSTGGESKKFVAYDKETLKPDPNESLEIDNALIQELTEGKEPFSNKNDLYIPCILEDRLIAFFALGHKLSEESFTEEDMHLLQALSSQTGIALDHTRSYEKIRNELIQTERQLEQSQRLASLGTLTAGVAHEIRNPLGIISSKTQRLADQPRDLEYLKQFRDDILRNSERITKITSEMNNLAKPHERKEVKLNLNDLINSMLELVDLNNHIKLHKDLNPIPQILGDEDEIKRIFINLINNSVIAMTSTSSVESPQGGALTISTYKEGDNKVGVKVADTGTGIAPENLTKIFDPFFSTRHEGTGLGLSIVYRIVKEHGGEIAVKSEVGKGTTFTILFPAVS